MHPAKQLCTQMYSVESKGYSEGHELITKNKWIGSIVLLTVSPSEHGGARRRKY